MTIKGAKAGKQKSHKPNISKDTIASTSNAKILYGLSEGETEGLAEGAKSIRLDGTPLLDNDGNNNFEGVAWGFRSGTNDQEYVKGFPDVNNETAVNVELKSDSPWVQAINNIQLSAVRVRLKWGRLAKQKDNGDVVGYRIDYAIDLKTDGSTYQTVQTHTINDKTSSGYKRTHRIDLPNAKSGWQIRVRRLTENSTSDLIQDKMYIDAFSEVIDVKLRYPNTALLGLQYDAETFQNIAKLAVRLKGKIIKVPSNYDPVSRQYTGLWDGTFKQAYTNNPAWIYYDICTAKRYGLGDRLTAAMVDKWSLYQLGRYCDEMVPDGKGGQEPRFSCNVYLQKQTDAYTVLSNIAGIFHAMSYWNGEQVVIDADVPQDPVYTFSRANVVDGSFEYIGTRQRDRHTVAKVAWDNPENDYKTEYEFIRDEQAIAKFGVKVVDISAIGCTSQAQAQRAGLWALKTEQLETRQVNFSVGLDGILPQVGNIINVSDELFAGRANSGRVSAVSDKQYVITLDRDVTVNVGDILVVNGGHGKSEKRTIKSISGRKITVTAPFAHAEREHVWAIEFDDLKLMRFRVMSITEGEDSTYAITAIQHEPQKYDAIDYGADVKQTTISIVNPDVISAPSEVTLESRHRIEQSQTLATLIINWSQVSDAVAYDVEWKKDDGTWIKLPRTTNTSAEIDGVYSGSYMARVRAVSAFDVQSKATISPLTGIKGKAGKPPNLAKLTATGILFGMRLDWAFSAGSGDADYVEIQVASAPNVNVAPLGNYSYPTDTATINGLQGGLTQYYRGRLVDKLGFKSDWSSWASGTTDNSADKVLALLDGKLSQSQLSQNLSKQIDKIDTTEAKFLPTYAGNDTILAGDNTRYAGITDVFNAIADGDKTIAEKITTLQTTVDSNTASVQTHARSLDGMSAQYTIKLDVNGRTSGIGLMNDGATSAFAVRSDSFYVASPDDDNKGVRPFIVLPSPQTINGVTVPAGTYIDSAFIHNASIDTAKIKDGSIKNAKLGNASIDTANIKDGAIKSAKIGVAEVDTLQIAGNAVIVPRVQFTPTDFEFYTIDREEEINRVSLDAKGGSVSISFGFESLAAYAGGDNSGENGRVIIRIKRDNVLLRKISFEVNGKYEFSSDRDGSIYKSSIIERFVVLPTFLDSPPAGEHAYTVTLESRGLNSGKSSNDTARYPVVIKARSLHMMGARR